MSKVPTAHDVDCEFVVSEDGFTVKVKMNSTIPIFKYKEGAQVIIDAVADAAMHYYSLSSEDWEAMAEGNDLDS